MRFNHVAIGGRLTADPELKYAASGTAICEMRLAFDQGTGQEKKAGYVNVTAFNKQAENASKYLKKGSAAMIGGRLEFQQWEKDGVKRSTIKIVAHDVQFLDGKKQDEPRPRPEPGGDGW